MTMFPCFQTSIAPTVSEINNNWKPYLRVCMQSLSFREHNLWKALNESFKFWPFLNPVDLNEIRQNKAF